MIFTRGAMEAVVEDELEQRRDQQDLP
jgi:hypothetical protein